jgi:hypothetical protein
MEQLASSALPSRAVEHQRGRPCSGSCEHVRVTKLPEPSALGVLGTAFAGLVGLGATRARVRPCGGLLPPSVEATVPIARRALTFVDVTPGSVRSMEAIDDADLKRLGRVADADLERFFDRNPHLHAWRERVLAIALAQGGAEHRLRGRRGIWDLDVIVCFGNPGKHPKLLRRQVMPWDWGPSKFGRCALDPPAYTGRAVDVKYWVIPRRRDPADALRAWLQARLAKAPDPLRKADVAHEPVILIRPPWRLGEVVWDPDIAPPAKESTTTVRRRPVGLAPP